MILSDELIGYYMAFLGLLSMLVATWLKLTVRRQIHWIAWSPYAVVGFGLLSVSLPAFFPQSPSMVFVFVALSVLKTAGTVGVCYLVWGPYGQPVTARPTNPDNSNTHR